MRRFEAADRDPRGGARDQFTRRLVRRAWIVCNAIAALTGEKHRLFPQSHNFVPGRSTVYKSCKKKLSLFGVPKNARLYWRSGDDEQYHVLRSGSRKTPLCASYDFDVR
ncbi:hypothetical protein HPB48_001545 [Haemaphysalis longicornis]|uniref:Uncharacterized protein n=1 Tax=Haemaphysalis longicornis TaxID=44386 RepID=A0A9J6FE66_HAELO|nr:hypothetical protein HPB48_001545 [Haemaphysalis longicornis]